jgi:hypothetical protein
MFLKIYNFFTSLLFEHLFGYLSQRGYYCQVIGVSVERRKKF